MQLILLQREQFEPTSKSIVALYDEYYEQLANFDHFLHALEKTRTESIKSVLKRAYQEFHQISYRLPFEIQQYFEAKILVSILGFLLNPASSSGLNFRKLIKCCSIICDVTKN